MSRMTEGHLVRHYQGAKGAKGGRDAALLDIAQDHVLHRLYQLGLFEQGLVFKGGTALRKFRAGNSGRFSTDLDFAAPDEPLAHSRTRATRTRRTAHPFPVRLSTADASVECRSHVISSTCTGTRPPGHLKKRSSGGSGYSRSIGTSPSTVLAVRTCLLNGPGRARAGQRRSLLCAAGCGRRRDVHAHREAPDDDAGQVATDAVLASWPEVGGTSPGDAAVEVGCGGISPPTSRRSLAATPTFSR